MLKFITSYLVCTAFCSFSVRAVSISFNTFGLDSNEIAIFEQAADFWESNLTGYRDGVDRTLTIDATVEAIDGLGGTLGSAGPTNGGFTNFVADADTTSGTFLIATNGSISFDEEDVDNLVGAGEFLDVVIHELGHVLGYGTLFSGSEILASGSTEFQEVYTSGTGLYTGSEGLAAYQAEFDPTATSIPIELDGGPGTADGHLNESSNNSSDPDPGDNLPAPLVLSGPNVGRSQNDEILTGFLSPNSFISSTTLGIFRDIGFTTAEDPIAIPAQTTIPEPSTWFLTMSGFTLMMCRRKRR